MPRVIEDYHALRVLVALLDLSFSLFNNVTLDFLSFAIHFIKLTRSLERILKIVG